jgi:inosine/guanosine/xanthosine phosphorylase family protein
MGSRALAEQAARVVLAAVPSPPELGVILATGFAPCADVLAEAVTIPFARLPGFRESAIPSHVNELVVGRLGDRTVAMVKAKMLPCDGASWEEAGLAARTLALAGCPNLFYTANSGSMREDVLPGDFMVITDHINFSGVNPLSSEREGGGWRTPYLSVADLYDPVLTARLQEGAESAGLRLPAGVAGYWMGPSFETPAEIAMARTAGCSVSSNSFLPEVMAAFHAGMRVVAVTFISTRSAGMGDPIVLESVLEVTRAAHDRFRILLRVAAEAL